MTKVDLIVIGAGPGGYETAVRAAKAGLHTAIVEAEKPGGTCLNVGCIPTKCFCRNAEMLRNMKEADVFGMENVSFTFNMRKVVERKNQVVASLVSGIETLLKQPLITYVHGTATFTGPHSIHVENAGDTAGESIDEDYEADYIIIATGSSTKLLPIPGKDLPKVLTSTEMLDLTEVPKRLCVIGGGVIGMEFASIFNTFGSKVTVLEYCKDILPNIDSDIAKRLKASFKGQGIDIINNAAVNEIEDKGDAYSVGYELKSARQSVEADIVLMAVGRGANTASLNLENAGIECDRRGIITNDDFETNVPGVYAIGDVNGKCQLAHAATFQGLHTLNLILGKEDLVRFDIIPAAVFTYPEAATVGVTSDFCKRNGMKFNAHKGFFRANGKALAMNETDGMVKILTDEENKIIGAHIFGPHAADLIQEITTLVNKNGKLSDLAQTVHAHPTLGEVVMNAAET